MKIIEECKCDIVEILEDFKWRKFEKTNEKTKYEVDEDGCIDLTKNTLNDTIFIRDNDSYNDETIILE